MVHTSRIFSSPLVYCAIAAGIFYSSAHSSAPWIRNEAVDKLRDSVRAWDIGAVRTAVRAGVCNNAPDINNAPHPFYMITMPLFFMAEKNRQNIEHFEEKFFQLLDIFLTETDLRIDTRRTYYEEQYLNKRTEKSSTLLQECFSDAWWDPKHAISRIAIARHLISRGARLHHTNSSGDSALHHLARWYADKNCVALVAPFKTSIPTISFISVMKELQKGYPQKTSGDTTTTMFEDDIAQINFISGILADIDDANSVQMARMSPEARKYLRFLKAQNEKTGEYFLSQRHRGHSRQK